MSMGLDEPYSMIVAAAGAKKFVSASAVADYGDSQALATAGGRTTGFEVGAVRFVNKSGSASLVGLGVRYRPEAWQAGQVTATGDYTDGTLAAQNATAGDFVVWQRGITTGNGFLVGATERFNTLGLILSAAGNQTTPVLLLEYWNGTAWTNLTTGLITTDVLLAAGTGEKVLAWFAPMDWTKGGSGAGVPQTTYNVRVTHTVATGGSADPTASQIFVGQTQFLTDAVANNAQAQFIYEEAIRFPRAGNALVPFFASAALANQVEVQWRPYL